MTKKIEEILNTKYKKNDSGIFESGNCGYWSNLDKSENIEFIKLLKSTDPLQAVRAVIPEQEDQIFSEKREAALELLDIKEDSVSIDYGCMWGVLSVGLVKRGSVVISIDQTKESLEFLNARRKYDDLNSMFIVQDDIKKVDLENISDFAIVNGVLEWVPETGEVELKKFFGQKSLREYSDVNPRVTQCEFLSKVKNNLKSGGKLLLAIENRYDYTQFLGKKDPHVDLFLTSILPRQLSNVISMIFLRRPYVNYIYSFGGLKNLILEAGFEEVDLYMVFPHYHKPELILPYKKGITLYEKYYSMRGVSLKRKIVWGIEFILMKYFKAGFFSPSIIAVAKK